MFNNFFEKRYATCDEVAIYNKVEALINEVNEQDELKADKMVEAIGAYVWAFPEERKRAYAKAYRIAKRFGVRVSDLVAWYCMD